MTRYFGPFAVLFTLLASGCTEEATDPIVNRITCADVCNRYQECFDEDYDVEACTDRCEDDATAREDKEDQLEECDACIDDESCASATFGCASQCVQFVP